MLECTILQVLTCSQHGLTCSRCAPYCTSIMTFLTFLTFPSHSSATERCRRQSLLSRPRSSRPRSSRQTSDVGHPIASDIPSDVGRQTTCQTSYRKSRRNHVVSQSESHHHQQLDESLQPSAILSPPTCPVFIAVESHRHHQPDQSSQRSERWPNLSPQPECTIRSTRTGTLH